MYIILSKRNVSWFIGHDNINFKKACCPKANNFTGTNIILLSIKYDDEIGIPIRTFYILSLDTIIS